ncbi:hypothetical protein [Bacillus suaedaesalsae]|uniref:ATP-dependent Lon protease n=1 Tax=Bacillus suaedaesalsae TaxID=2810349 RepID=A0ABS2DK07_9BACI|nr:hypothetical protein [Bacillus suaedaesalsae]MBM6617861.1 hypothetical protein [Bacillus suaedaesalsae]
MYLFLSIILATVLAYILWIVDPFVAGIVGFGIVVGCIFRGLYLLNDLHKRISKFVPKEDKAQEVYNKYLEEKETDV